MSITMYSKYRRMKLRKAWEFSGMTNTTIKMVLCVAVLFAAYIFASYVEQRIEDGISKEKARASKAEKVLAHFLNGKSVMDTATGDVFFADVSKQEDL